MFMLQETNKFTLCYFLYHVYLELLLGNTLFLCISMKFSILSGIHLNTDGSFVFLFQPVGNHDP